MSYRQFTQCISASNYIGSALVQAIIGGVIGLLPLIIGLVFGALALGPGALALLFAPLLALLAYCRWWLYGRLICLGGDVCAVGTLLSVEPPENKSFPDSLDTDFSINLLLAPHSRFLGATQSEVETDGLQGNLIKNQPDIIAHSFPFRGETAQVPFSDDPPSAVLHCEFEGGGVYDMMISCLAALGYNTVALIAATIICAIPIIGWLACLIISLIFAAITVGLILMGMSNALNDKGNPNDVNSNLGNLEQGKDLLVVQGTWVYDSAHEGWNEIHPIKQCQRIGQWGAPPSAASTWGDFFDRLPPGVPRDLPTFIKFWCDSITKANDPFTLAEQKKPQNQWEIHPLIDGCDSGSDPPPPILR
jgi:hypothetical protein